MNTVSRPVCNPACSAALNSARRPTGRAPRRQRGNALAFALLALVIGAIVMVVGVRQYAQSERSASIQDVTAEAVAVIGNAKATYGQYAYTGTTTAMAVGGAIIPRTRAISPSAANDKFSGAITLVDNNATTQGTALLTYASIPQDQCAAIVIGSESLARQVKVGGVDVKVLDGTLNPVTLNAQCISATSVPIAWVIGST